MNPLAMQPGDHSLQRVCVINKLLAVVSVATQMHARASHSNRPEMSGTVPQKLHRNKLDTLMYIWTRERSDAIVKGKGKGEGDRSK